MPTEMELTLEQTQQGVSYEVSKPENTGSIPSAVRNTQVWSDIKRQSWISDAMHHPPPRYSSQKDFVFKTSREIHFCSIDFSLELVDMKRWHSAPARSLNQSATIESRAKRGSS
ncbi:hypothetical protein Tco_0947718 [Tanacetum coccineum]